MSFSFLSQNKKNCLLPGCILGNEGKDIISSERDKKDQKELK